MTNDRYKVTKYMRGSLGLYKEKMGGASGSGWLANLDSNREHAIQNASAILLLANCVYNRFHVSVAPRVYMNGGKPASNFGVRTIVSNEYRL